MSSNEALLKLKENLEAKLNGKGSLCVSKIFPLLISASIYGSLMILFVWILPNIAMKLFGFTMVSTTLFSLPMSVSVVVALLLMMTAFYFYNQFMRIPLTSSTIKLLREKFKDCPLIIETMDRWIREKGFLNYTDKETFRTYASICEMCRNITRSAHPDDL